MRKVTAKVVNNHQHSDFMRNLLDTETYNRVKRGDADAILQQNSVPQSLEWFLQPSVKFKAYRRAPDFFGNGAADPNWPGVPKLNVHYIDGEFSVHDPRGIELFVHEAGHAVDLLLRNKTEKLRSVDFGLKPTLLDDIPWQEAVDKAPSLQYITMTVSHELRAIALSEKLRVAINDSLDQKLIWNSGYFVELLTSVIPIKSHMRARPTDWKLTANGRNPYATDKANSDMKAMRKAIAKHGYSISKPRFSKLQKLTSDQLAVLATSLQLLNQQYHISDIEFYAKFIEFALPSLFDAWSKWDHVDIKAAWNDLCKVFADIQANKSSEEISTNTVNDVEYKKFILNSSKEMFYVGDNLFFDKDDSLKRLEVKFSKARDLNKLCFSKLFFFDTESGFFNKKTKMVFTDTS